ncbi:MAG: hypothetical protein ACPG6B_00450 [Oceanihabitans sp.]
MHPVLKNILAVIIGWLAGSVINMSLIKLGHNFLPIPGVDPNDMIALADVMPTLEPKYFIFPFLAHAIGTLVGACIAALIAHNNKIIMALIVGVLFLFGGIAVNYMLPGPTWFAVADILFAYIPMAWLGNKLAVKFAKK